MEAMAQLRFGFEVEAEERGKELGALEMLFSLVKDGDVSPEKAAKKAKMSTMQFMQKMAEAEQADADQAPVPQ